MAQVVVCFILFNFFLAIVIDNFAIENALVKGSVVEQTIFQDFYATGAVMNVYRMAYHWPEPLALADALKGNTPGSIDKTYAFVWRQCARSAPSATARLCPAEGTVWRVAVFD